MPVWGIANPGEQVTVSLSGQNVGAIAGLDGRWIVRLPAMNDGEPHSMVIAGDHRIQIEDVWIGELWICSGQSNMERQLGPCSGQQPPENWEQEAASADYPQIRHFAVARTPAEAWTSPAAIVQPPCKPPAAALQRPIR